jgi:nucleoside triphosphate pyrophosphatase
MSVPLVLASSSVSRRIMLEAAGVPFMVAVPNIDEDAIKSLLTGSGGDGYQIADELAQAKAISVSAHMHEALVLGADQVLVCEGRFLNKALTEAEARKSLLALSGREHQLISSAVIARGGVSLWRRTEVATLRMRLFSRDFLDSYLAAEIPEILGSVGCYRIEGRGVQLFTEVKGDQFCIRGLPLMAVLAALRDFGVLPV